jgi:type IV secretion/conjugal transfer VirB4 family ATPase
MPLKREIDTSIELYDYARSISLLDLLDDQATITTRNIQGKLGLCQTIRLEGIDPSALSIEEKEHLHEILKGFFNNMRQEAVYSIYTDRKEVQSEVKKQCHGNVHAERLATKYEKQFRAHYKTETHLVVYYEVGSLITNPFGLISNESHKERENLRRKVFDLSNIVNEVHGLLEEYNPSVLKGDALLKFWGYHLNAGREVIPPSQTTHMGRLLALTEARFSTFDNLIEYTFDKSRKYAAYLSINYYPDMTSDEIMSPLYRLELQFSIIQHAIALSRDKVGTKLDNMIHKMASIPGFFSGQKLQELQVAGSRAAAEEIRFCEHIFSICVYGDTEEVLEKNVAKIKSELAKTGISTIRESINLESAFLAVQPGNYSKMSARSAKITTENMACFVSFVSSQQGHSSCAFGNDYVSRFKTRDESMYNFIFQNSPEMSAPGHMLIISETGGGKTVLANWLLMQCLKFYGDKGDKPCKELIFDSKKGCLIPVKAFGGHYIDVSDESLALNPLHLEDTPTNKAFLESFIAMLAGGANIEEQKAITRAIADNYDLPDKQHRYLHNIRDQLGTEGVRSDGTPKIIERLEKWLPFEHDPSESGFSLGMKFSAAQDSLDFSRRVVGFDMDAVLGDHSAFKDLLAPLAAYIFHTFTTKVQAEGSPHVCFIDEMWKYIKDPFFGKFIEEGYKEWRKKKGVVIGAVQNTSALFDNKVGKEIVQNTTTFALFPNAGANEEHYRDGLGLHESEFNWIKKSGSQKKQGGGRHVMFKRRNGRSVILNIDLSMLGNDLNLLTSEIDYIHRAEEAMKKYGDDQWVEPYLETFN